VNSLRQRVKEFIPNPLWGLARESWLLMRHWALWPGAFLHPLRRQSISRLGKFHNIHQGQRAFILGNGPSLAKMDLNKLSNEISFGMNRIFLAFANWEYRPTYFLTVNDLVLEQSAEDIEALKMNKFLSWRNRGKVSHDEYTHYLHTTYERPRFAQDVRGRLWEGATVTYIALQLAYFMGCDPVVLVGVDHNFTTKGPANQTVTSQGDDKDHFDADYFGAGFRWQLPDLEASERAYKMAKQAFARDGREVLDATMGGKLNVFPKVEYTSLF
jgi:hypothetical protein